MKSCLFVLSLLAATVCGRRGSGVTDSHPGRPAGSACLARRRTTPACIISGGRSGWLSGPITSWSTSPATILATSFMSLEFESPGVPRGEILYHWRYETVDLAPYLRTGDNLLAAVVWNDGRRAAVAQVSNETGFLLQADSANGQVVNSGAEWRAVRDEAYKPLYLEPGQATGLPTRWRPPNNSRVLGIPGVGSSKDSTIPPWPKAVAGLPGSPRDAQDAPSRWMLVPRSLPPMEEVPERLSRIRKGRRDSRAGGLPRPATRFPRARQHQGGPDPRPGSPHYRIPPS